MVGLGYVSNINDKGCFIKVSPKLTVRASLRELTDKEMPNPLSMYKANDLVLFRITSAVENKKKVGDKLINVSLRESIIKYGLTLSLRDLKPGQVRPCIVRKRESPSHLWVQIKGSCLLGVTKNAPEDLIEGELITCKIEKIETEEGEKRAKIKLLFQEKADTSSEPSKIEELYNRIALERKQEHEAVAAQSAPMTDVAAAQPILVEKEGDEEKKAEPELKPDELEAIEEISKPKEAGEEEGDESEGEPVIQETLHEEDDEPMREDKAEEASKVEPMKIDEPEKKAEEKKREPTMTLKEKIREEKRVRKIEKQNASQTAQTPQSIEDFEKQATAEPNSSLVWLQYVAFMLDHAGIDSARRVMERAIKTVDMTRMQEKLNLWIGYLNLESTYGSVETLQAYLHSWLCVE